MSLSKNVVVALAALGHVAVAGVSPVAAANIVILNADSPGEGLNDPTVVSPVGGNPGTTLGAQRMHAVQHAASIWAGIIESDITINIDTRFDPLSCDASEAELGFGGPMSWATLTVPQAVPDTWYPIPLANKIRDLDINFFISEIQLTLTTRLDTGCAFPRTWYYGLDGAGDPGTTLDVVTIALREIGHGLGFNTFVDLTTGARVNDRNDIFMLFLEDLTTGKTWDEMSDSERVSSAANTGNLVWNGPRVTASAGILGAGTNDGKVVMHAPAAIEPGISVIHWDPSATPDELMESSLTAAIHDPSLARALMVDIGWTLETCGDGVVDIGEYCDSALECCTSSCDIADEGTVCDDGLFCNGTETCDALGGCTGPSTGNPCPTAPIDDNCSLACDEDLGGCFGAFADGVPCDDGDICTAASECETGICVGDESVNLCAIDSFVGYKSRAPRRDGSGNTIANTLPKNWVIKANDFHLPDAADDDPEHFEIRKAQGLLKAALQNADTVFEDPTARYLRYQMRPGKEGTGDLLPNGRYPRPAKHIKRTWELSNAFGTIKVESSKVQALFLPAAVSMSPLPPAPADNSHYACYKVKPTRDITDQTPDTGKGVGRLRRDMQGFFVDAFDDCALDVTGGPSFPASPVQGRCLFNLGRITEFCSPIDKSPVDPGRETQATLTETTPTTTDLGLLCYQAKPATKIADPTVAAILGQSIGERVLPKQRKHVKRSFRTGMPIFTTPGNDFPAPPVIETTKLDAVCLPTEVLSVVPVP